MNLRNRLFLKFSRETLKKNELSLTDPATLQKEVFYRLIAGGADTLFGKEHNFSSIESVESVPGGIQCGYNRSVRDSRSWSQ